MLGSDQIFKPGALHPASQPPPPTRLPVSAATQVRAHPSRLSRHLPALRGLQRCPVSPLGRCPHPSLPGALVWSQFQPPLGR